MCCAEILTCVCPPPGHGLPGIPERWNHQTRLAVQREHEQCHQRHHEGEALSPFDDEHGRNGVNSFKDVTYFCSYQLQHVCIKQLQYKFI